MIDNTRIKTGYDVEILLGSEYFMTIFYGAYDSGEIQSQVDLGNGALLNINRPISCQLLPNSVDADLEIIIPVELIVTDMPPLPHDATIGLFIDITMSDFRFEYSYLDDLTRNLITTFETTSGIPGILEEVENKLRTDFERDINLDLVSETIIKLDTRKISGSDGYQDAFGLYANLNIRTIRANPFVSFDIDQYIDRGTLINGISFLPNDRSFAVGFSKDTFQRFENDAWNNLAVQHPNGYYYFPVMDGDEVVGNFTDLDIILKNGFIKVIIKMKIIIDNWPDANVTAVFRYIPRISNGVLTVDMELRDFDADTGLLGDFLGFLIGTLFFSLIGFLTGELGGAAILAAFGGVGGVITVEITEDVLADKFGEDAVEDRSIGIDNAFETFPVRNRIFADQKDPFYNLWYVLVNYYDEVNINSNGMSLAGHALIETENEPTHVTVIDKERGESADSWNGFLTLIYRMERAGNIILPILEVLQRIQRNELAQVFLTPTHIHRKFSMVSDIQFNSGLDLHVAESVALQDAGVIHVNGYQLIHPLKLHLRYNRIPNPYYRARANESKDDNFESLPIFNV
ncbi:MAG: hypothetical protein V3V33_10020 [Candidatus Lokiarchaeia archaeon]